MLEEAKRNGERKERLEIRSVLCRSRGRKRISFVLKQGDRDFKVRLLIVLYGSKRAKSAFYKENNISKEKNYNADRKSQV